MARRLSHERALRRLALLSGIQPRYIGMTGDRQQASPETLLRVLMALNPAVGGLADVPEALRLRLREPWRRRLEPVGVAWARKPARVEYFVPPGQSDATLAWELALEGGGEVRRGRFDLATAPVLRHAELDGQRLVSRRMDLPAELPIGYHRLAIEDAAGRAEMMLIVAPARAYDPYAAKNRPKNTPAKKESWGVFIPLYALRSERSWGAGNLTDFENLIDWTSSLGGDVVATLPLMASFLEEPFDPSPYAPVSRMFWNELYLDVTRVAEFARSARARELIDSTPFHQEVRELRGEPLVDYRQQWALKRRVIAELARTFFAGPSERRTRFEHDLKANPRLADYAAFRAVCRRRQTGWPDWPEPLRAGRLGPGDYDEEDRRFFLYAQWAVGQQMDHLARKARQNGAGLYLDLPLGVHPDGYDVWRERDAFALGIAGGAPPDGFFSKGQNWGFPPLHPERIRQRQYQGTIEGIRQILRHAGILRIDHVMGLHRLFWIPEGMEAAEGVYVRYHADEFYAILNLESHRSRSMIIGEDLGTVPPAVTRALRKHNIHRMYVLEFNVNANPHEPIRPIFKNAVASMNTHDMATFAGFWQARDTDSQRELGLINDEQAAHLRAGRAAHRHALIEYFRQRGKLGEQAQSLDEQAALPLVFKAATEALATSPARIVLINLEDLWQETAPQNVPGTRLERPNWRRRARLGLEEFSTNHEINQLLREVDRLRAERSAKPDGKD